MMDVCIAGQLYRVDFTHAPGDGKTYRKLTTCRIFRLPWDDDPMPVAESLLAAVFGAPPLATGEARCSMADRFNRDTGRKLALTRALDKLEHDAPEWHGLDRAAVWYAYHRARGDEEVARSLLVDWTLRRGHGYTRNAGEAITGAIVEGRPLVVAKGK